MHRGATILKGEGAFTSEKHSILMVALTSTEIATLKEIVAGIAPEAFVMVIPARNILGRGFMPLDEE